MEHQPLKSPIGKKNTQIWEAYQEALKELQEKESVASTTEVAAAQRRQAAIKVAEGLDVDKMTSALEDLALGTAEAIKQFQELNSAIDEKKEELKTVHELEYKANASVALIAAKDKLVKDREEQAESIISEAVETRDRILADAGADAKAIDDAAAHRKAEFEETAKRATEQWAYDFARKKRIDLDSIQDDIDAKMKLLNEREAYITDREQTIQNLDTKIIGLETQLDAKEAAIETRIEAAVKEAVDRANKSGAIAKTMAEKELRGEMAVLQAKNESLEGIAQDLRDRLARAEKRTEDASARVTTIATAALKADADAATVAEVSKIAAGSGQKGK
jgi:hypothetical protein